MKPVKETNLGLATASPLIRGLAKENVEEGAAAPTQHAAQALQYDVSWSCLELWTSFAECAGFLPSASVLSINSC